MPVIVIFEGSWGCCSGLVSRVHKCQRIVMACAKDFECRWRRTPEMGLCSMARSPSF